MAKTKKSSVKKASAKKPSAKKRGAKKRVATADPKVFTTPLRNLTAEELIIGLLNESDKTVPPAPAQLSDKDLERIAKAVNKIQKGA